MAGIQPPGLTRGLTDNGDANYSAYLRQSFASSMGYSRWVLERPIVGICIQRAVSTIAIAMSLN